jgi:metal-responsive CopG/Arc/MetJ family transcriptional regulator
MANVKTAISLQKSLFEQVEALAHEKKVSRSRLFVMAVEDYLRREQNRRLAEQLNAVYGGEPDPEQKAFQRKMKRQFRERVEGEW